MKLLLRRAHIVACEAWLVSAVVHLVLLIVVSLLFAPMLGDLFATIELEATFVDTGDVPVLFEMSAAPTLDPDEAELSVPSGATPMLTIDNLSVAARMGSDGHGSRHLTAGRGGPSGKVGASNRASFFGTQATGDRFVYVLDVSPSMTPQRLARAATELLRSIDQLRENQEFYVVLFGWDTRRMFDEGGVPTPFRATLENKRRLRSWLFTVNSISGTDPREALRLSLGMAADSVYFLSDGEFNQPSTSRYFTGEGPTVMEIVRKGNPNGTPVHTIAFEDRRSEPAMAVIATITNGQHRFVPADGRPTEWRKRRANRTEFHDAIEQFLFSEEKPVSVAMPASATTAMSPMTFEEAERLRRIAAELEIVDP